VDKIVDAKIYLEVSNVYVLQDARVTLVNDAYVTKLNSDLIPAKLLYVENTHFVNRSTIKKLNATAQLNIPQEIRM
jgi:hypothetical protein